jgi:hypothetical protein
VNRADLAKRARVVWLDTLLYFGLRSDRISPRERAGRRGRGVLSHALPAGVSVLVAVIVADSLLWQFVVLIALAFGVTVATALFHRVYARWRR